MNGTITDVYVGVDVSKNNLDVYIHPLNKKMRIANTEQGIKSLIDQLKGLSVGQVVCEASGGYEFLMYELLSQANYKVWRVEPKRVKAFIYSEGQRAKTDAIDAKMLALFASQKTCKYTVAPITKLHHEIEALIKCRATLVEMAAKQKTQLQAPMMNRYCNELFDENIAFFEQQIKTLDKKIRLLIKQDQELSEKIKLLCSMKGIGFTTAVTLAVEVPELGLVNKKEIAAIIGVAPFAKQSGNYVGNSTITGGRSAPRHLLYMAALSASQTDSVLGEFYRRLRASGKKAKIALVALMRKMIIVLNTLVSKGEMWVSTMS